MTAESEHRTGAPVEGSAVTDLDTLADASARFAADLYWFVARRVITELGEAGERAVRQGLREFGLARGEAIRAGADASEEEIDLAAFIRHYDLPMARAWQGESTTTARQKDSIVTFCPMAEQWRARGGPEIGQIYCEEVDGAIREGYSPDLHFTASQFILRDCAPCLQRDEMEPL
jgi:hypothetical protein